MFSDNYEKLIDYFEKNKNKKWDEWLTFDKILDAQGKQGKVGIFKNKENSELQYLFKLSQNINYLAYHELVIMQGLNEITKYCPHFCKGIGLIKANVEPSKKSKNPFEINSKYPIEKEILLCEYIKNSSKFYNYIYSDKINENIIYSIIKQVLMATNIAQIKKKFTHYDLHSNNVMVKKCNKNLVFLYKLDEENQFCVPTHGYFPIIIDYGFSYISDMNDGPLWTSLAHTEVGFLSDRFDWVADPKLFLISVSDELKESKKSKNSKKFRRIVKNIFFPLKVDMECGWDNEEDKSAIDYVLDMIQTYNGKSKIFKDYDYYCIDIIQSLIILPLQEQDTKNIGKSFTIFLNEWVKIENEISNEFYNIYILKEIVDIARNIRPQYLKKDTREHSILLFKKKIYMAINKISAFCNPKNIDFEKMLCSLLLLAENIEGVLYTMISATVKNKEKRYEKMPVKNLNEIYASIDINIKDDYVYNQNTIVYIIDNNNEKNDIFNIPNDEIDNINELHPISRGCYIYDLYINNKK